MDDLAIGLEQQRAGLLDDARVYYRRFLERHPARADTWASLGVVALRQMDLDEAIRCHVRSLELKPESAEVLANLGVAYALKRDFVSAERVLRKATSIRPPCFEAYLNLAHALRENDQLDEAVQAYEQALMLRPDHVDLLASLGKTLHKANRAAEAIEPLHAACKLAPESIEAHYFLGLCLTAAKRFDEAEAAFDRAVALDPSDAHSHNGLGIVRAKAKRLEAAEASFREAIRLNPQFQEAHQNLGNALRDSDRYDEALACYEAALELCPDSIEAYNNLGIALARLGRLEDALRAYDRAIALDPKHSLARKNRGIIKLTSGDYAEGFADFEYRWNCDELVRPNIPRPLWVGESIAGKTILLNPEQGLGDTIQFIRYAPRFRALGASVVLHCPKALHNLFRGVVGVDVLASEGKPLPPFDTHISLMSLPAIFRTRLEDVPKICPVPYLRADPELVERWGGRIGERAPGDFRVGICWQGNPAHGDDRLRSAPLEAFLPMANVPGVKLFSLQKNYGLAQIAGVADRLPVADFPDCTRFEDTAAIISLLDLVITIDSAPVHLAGALGVPTWLALATYADWRWLIGREDSPWYPTVRIFRQRKIHDWSDVFERMAGKLTEIACDSEQGHDF